MKTRHLVLIAATALAIGCSGTESTEIAPSVAGTWRFLSAASDGHPACNGRVTLTETAFDAPSIMGGIPGHLYIDGLYSCADGSGGIMAGDRVDDAIDIALDANEVVWRTTADLSAETMIGPGFSAVREHQASTSK